MLTCRTVVAGAPTLAVCSAWLMAWDQAVLMVVIVAVVEASHLASGRAVCQAVCQAVGQAVSRACRQVVCGAVPAAYRRTPIHIGTSMSYEVRASIRPETVVET
ncbi:hypothetical protein GCM10009856_07370 [Mycolicibacterium llatzerense]